jgi:prefoldin subunit 5
MWERTRSLFHFATKQDLRRINMKLNELAGQLTSLADQVDKIKLEVEALKASLENVELPAEAQAALERLGAAVKAVDDANPDAVAS